MSKSTINNPQSPILNRQSSILITRFPYSSELGGIETFTLHFAQKWQEKGFQVKFLGNCRAISRLFIESQIPLRNVWLPKSPVNMGSIVLFLLCLPYSLVRSLFLVRSFPPNSVIYMIALTDKLLLTWFCHRKKLTVIWGEHETLQDGQGRWRKWLKKNPFLPLYRYLSRHATVVPVSYSLEKQFHKLGGIRNIEVIEGAIAKTKITAQAQESTTFVIGTAGRLKAEKGLFELLDLAARFKNRQDIRFDIYGEGPLKNRLCQEILRQELQDVVFVRGKIAPENMGNIYQGFDMAIFLSREAESFGLAPLEAMACGVPTIITHQFGFLQETEDHPYIIVDPKNTDEILSIIAHLITDESYRKSTGLVQQNYVNQQFSEEKMIEAYLKLVKHDVSPKTTLF